MTSFPGFCRRVAVSGLAASLIIATPATQACGFDGGIDGNWTSLHPQSINVAIAVRKAADNGVLDAALLDVRAAGPQGLSRATGRLRDLGTRLSANNAPPTSLLLVESGLWARYAGTQKAMVPEIHIDGPEQGDVVIVTSEATIAAMLAGRISARRAMGLGLLAFDGPADSVSAAKKLLAGLAPEAPSVAMRR